MRKILFRGKRIYDGKWSESVCPHGEMHSGTITYDYDRNTVGEYTGLNDKNGKKIFEGDIITYFEEIENVCYNSLSYRETTGLFEPNRERHNEKFTGVVSFDKDFCGYIVNPVSATCHITYVRKSLRDFSVKNIEVIGNIFDNSKLLTED